MTPRPNSSDDTVTRPTIELTAEAVVASYIHSISERHRPPDPSTDEAAARPSGD